MAQPTHSGRRRNIGPRRKLVQGVLLLVPPVRSAQLPPNGSFSSFLGIPALRFNTPAGPVAVFLHDLAGEDLRQLLEVQREQAVAQLGSSYSADGRERAWWEAP